MIVRNSFALRYGTRCANCNLLLESGEPAFYMQGRDMPIGLDCCGDLPEAELAPPIVRGDPEVDLMVAQSQVMPRGRNAQDMCSKCFQIPASNGVCGCVC